MQQAGEEHATAPESAPLILSFCLLNRIEDTIAAISSALEQHGVTKHIWIVDQASDAKQHARLQAFVRGKPVVVKSLRQNVGVSAGRNIASRMGGAPYIVALDNDAVFNNPHTLERAIAHLEADPVLGAVGFCQILVTTSVARTMFPLGSTIRRLRITPARNSLRRNLLAQGMLCEGLHLRHPAGTTMSYSSLVKNSICHIEF